MEVRTCLELPCGVGKSWEGRKRISGREKVFMKGGEDKGLHLLALPKRPRRTTGLFRRKGERGGFMRWNQG